MSNTRVEWETEDETHRQGSARKGPSPVPGPFDGLTGVDRAISIQRQLTQAVDKWWQQGEMPPIGLVRDGLLALEAGHRLAEAELTLLLRSTLYYGKGMRTALHHLNNPERAASVMRDMLLHPVHPLPPAQIVELARKDDESGGWLAALTGLLREEVVQPLEPRRTLAQANLDYLRKVRSAGDKLPEWTALGSQRTLAGQATAANRSTQRKAKVKRGGSLPAPLRRRLATFFGLLALALLVLSFAFFWLDLQQSFDSTDEMVTIPSGVYRIPDPTRANTDRLVDLQSFSIDRTEVTNAAYRLCFEADACTRPARTTSVTQLDYFLNPALDNFPMINVTHVQAALFCRWAGERLPLEEEWETAASSAWSLQRAFRYPWGDNFDSARVNGAATAIGDTMPVGTYSPGGDSPSKAADMAGNVAEWTATAGNPSQQPAVAYVVKGGSFQDDKAALATNSRVAVDDKDSFPWLGFRCAVTNPREEQQ